MDYVIKEVPRVIKELREMSAFRKETEEFVMSLKDEHDDDCET